MSEQNLPGIKDLERSRRLARENVARLIAQKAAGIQPVKLPPKRSELPVKPLVVPVESLLPR